MYPYEEHSVSAVIGGLVLMAVILAIIGLPIYVAIHFILKFW